MSAPDKDLPNEIADSLAIAWAGENGRGPSLASLVKLYGYSPESFERQLAAKAERVRFAEVAIWEAIDMAREMTPYCVSFVHDGKAIISAAIAAAEQGDEQ